MRGETADRLDGKTVLITGGGRGYGAEMARAVARAGAAVAVASRNLAECRSVVSAICDNGGDAIALETDVADDQSVGRAVEAATKAFGGIDILINNAALLGPIGSLTDSSDAEWMQTINVNLIACVRTARAAIPRMIKRGGGHIINLSSGTARFSIRRVLSLSYTTSKYAVEGLSHWLAIELERHGIRVNAFVPGLAETTFLKDMPDGYLRGMTCQVAEHIGPALLHLLTGNLPTGVSFEALPWLESQGLLARYSYVHD